MKLKVGDIVRAYGMPFGPEWNGVVWVGIITDVGVGCLIHWIDGDTGFTTDEYYEEHDPIYLHEPSK